MTAGLAVLSIAQQQMVEIARAISDPNVKTLVLDEPTSSLPAEQTTQLQDSSKVSARKDVSYIYISHYAPFNDSRDTASAILDFASINSPRILVTFGSISGSGAAPTRLIARFR